MVSVVLHIRWERGGTRALGRAGMGRELRFGMGRYIWGGGKGEEEGVPISREKGNVSVIYRKDFPVYVSFSLH